MKRTFKGLLLTAMLAVPAVFAISACSKSDSGTGGQPSSPTEASQPPSETSQAPAHDHVLQFDSFVWDKSVSGSWIAKAKLVCTADDGYYELKDAQVIRTGNAPTCTEAGGYHYKAVYMGNENVQDEVLPALGHDWNEPTWTWNGDNTEATAKFVCKRNPEHFEVRIAKQSEGAIECLHMDAAHCLDEGLDKYVATVDFYGTEYKGEKEVVLPATGHMYNVFGYCIDDGAYLGQEIPTPRTITLPALEAGEKAYYYYEPAWVGHKLYYSCSTALDSCEVRFGKLANKSFDSLDFSKTPTVIRENDIGTDNNIYIYIKANSAIAAGEQFTLYEDCDINEIGYCPACEEYYGETFSIGTPSDPITDVKKDDVLYWKAPAIPGHSYKFTNLGGAVIPSDIVGRYYIGAEGVIQNYDITDPFPATAQENYIYLKAIAGDNGTASIKLDFLGHPLDEYGACQDHSYYSGTELADSVEVPAFSMLAGDEKYFRFPSSLVVEGQFTLFYGSIHHDEVTVADYYDGNYHTLEASSGDDNTEDFYEIITGDYVYIKVVASVDHTNVTGFELAIPR